MAQCLLVSSVVIVPVMLPVAIAIVAQLNAFNSCPIGGNFPEFVRPQECPKNRNFKVGFFPIIT
jgi:hypothetical protein